MDTRRLWPADALHEKFFLTDALISQASELRLGDGKNSQAEARGIANQIRCPFTGQDVAAVEKPILDQVSAGNVTATLG